MGVSKWGGVIFHFFKLRDFFPFFNLLLLCFKIFEPGFGLLGIFSAQLDQFLPQTDPRGRFLGHNLVPKASQNGVQERLLAPLLAYTCEPRLLIPLQRKSFVFGVQVGA